MQLPREVIGVDQIRFSQGEFVAALCSIAQRRYDLARRYFPLSHFLHGQRNAQRCLIRAIDRFY